MASAATTTTTSGATATNPVAQAPGGGSRNAVRQTRTNPSRVSKTAARSFPYYGQQSASDAPQTVNVPHGLYPALTHFTDAITALPREFRRHNSLLKEVDAKAWALEDNLYQLLLNASDSRSVPFPPNPAPIIDGVLRDDYRMAQNDPENVESQESRQRRLLFDRIRHTLSDLMLTADEKNHVLTNANEELDHQLYRLNAIYPYISTEVSDEARLGSLTHWAYSNRAAAKAAAKTTTGSERPRREAASATSHLVQALHEAEAAAHRSDARREAVRKQRRGHAESDFDEARASNSRKGTTAKSRVAGGDSADSGTVPKRRRIVEKPVAIQIGSAAMERSTSTVTNNGRTASKESAGAEIKKRVRAPNAVSTAGRKRNNTVTSTVDSPLASSPVVGVFNPPRAAMSPGPRPQSSRAQQPATQAASRQRRPSAAMNNNNITDKPAESSVNVLTQDPVKEKTPQVLPGDANSSDNKKDNSDTKSNLSLEKDDRPEIKSLDNANATEQMMSPALSTIAPTKGRTSKTATPVVSTFAESQTRARSSRNNTETAPATTKRSHKKTNSTTSAVYKAKIAVREDEDSSREGDDEDDESEPRYCYCNQVSFGEMVACDNDACPTEWFHLSCVGLTKPPGRNVKWFCTECKENMKRGRISAK